MPSTTSVEELVDPRRNRRDSRRLERCQSENCGERGRVSARSSSAITPRCIGRPKSTAVTSRPPSAGGRRQPPRASRGPTTTPPDCSWPVLLRRSPLAAPRPTDRPGSASDQAEVAQQASRIKMEHVGGVGGEVEHVDERRRRAEQACRDVHLVQPGNRADEPEHVDVEELTRDQVGSTVSMACMLACPSDQVVRLPVW